MSRKMRNLQFPEWEIEVQAHIILRNFWEYYVTTEKTGLEDQGIINALVVGFETELGDVSIEEISPYVIAHTRNLNSIQPAPGWEWSSNGSRKKTKNTRAVNRRPC